MPGETNWWAYSADSPNYLARYGGPQRVADLLTEIGYGDGRPVTRQAAYSLWTHRHSNGFPDRVRVQIPGGWRQLFDLDEVRAWAADPDRGARVAIRATVMTGIEQEEVDDNGTD
jgi:hypothetical protein